MTKTVKNLLIGFTLVCAIVFAVFCIELVVQNRNEGENEESIRSQAGSPPTGPTGANNPPVGSSPSPPVTAPATGQTSETPKESSPQPTGKKYELLYSEDETLILYADEELFEHDDTGEMADLFRYANDENASLLISFVSFPLGAEKCAEDILGGYLGENPAFISGIGPIRHSSLRGIFGTGVNNGETFEVWVHSIPGDDPEEDNDIGMSFVIRYRSNEQRNALYAVLDTLELTDSAA